MAPLVESWPPSELPLRSQITTKDRRRKDFHGDLKGCELLEMLQYHCEVEKPATRESLTKCWPVVRLFRRCKDRQGEFMVETTAWEGERKGKLYE